MARALCAGSPRTCTFVPDGFPDRFEFAGEMMVPGKGDRFNRWGVKPGTDAIGVFVAAKAERLGSFEFFDLRLDGIGRDGYRSLDPVGDVEFEAGACGRGNQGHNLDAL